MTAVQCRQNINLVIMIVNVCIDVTLGTSLASHSKQCGNHWVVVAYDLNAKASFYCDPLGYPVPSNLAVETQQAHNELGNILGKQTGLSFPMTAMHQAQFDTKRRHVCSRHCRNFPVQICSSACGVIAMCFLAIASFCSKVVWQYICSLKNDADVTRSLLTVFFHVRSYAPYLRITLASWILEQKIDIYNLVDTRVHSDPNPSLKLKREEEMEWLSQKVVLQS